MLMFLQETFDMPYYVILILSCYCSVLLGGLLYSIVNFSALIKGSFFILIKFPLIYFALLFIRQKLNIFCSVLCF